MLPEAGWQFPGPGAAKVAYSDHSVCGPSFTLGPQCVQSSATSLSGSLDDSEQAKNQRPDDYVC